MPPRDKFQKQIPLLLNIFRFFILLCRRFHDGNLFVPLVCGARYGNVQCMQSVFTGQRIHKVSTGIELASKQVKEWNSPDTCNWKKHATIFRVKNINNSFSPVGFDLSAHTFWYPQKQIFWSQLYVLQISNDDWQICRTLKKLHQPYSFSSVNRTTLHLHLVNRTCVFNYVCLVHHFCSIFFFS